MKGPLACSLVVLLAASAIAARVFVGASSQYGIHSGLSGVSGYPLTMAIWVKFNSTNGGQAIFAVNSATTARAQIATGNDQGYSANSVDSGGVSVAARAYKSWQTNQWYHFTAVFESTNSRSIYVNGVWEANDVSTNILSGADRVIVAARIASGSIGAYASIVAAEAAVWNVALGAAEIASLASGAKPFRLRPGNLVHYTPLWGEGSTEPNLVGPVLGLTNGPTKADHPPVF